MAVSFGGAVSANAPVVYDLTLPTNNGGAAFGIGLRGADGVAVPGAAYMGPPPGVTPVVKFDTDGNVATP